MKIGFIGAGHMGAPMAARLAAAGHEVRVWNRTRAKAAAVPGATAVDTPAQAVEGAEVVFTMLADDAATEAVLEAIAASPAIHVAASTISVALSARLAKLGRYVAAPVFGRPPAAAEGKLVIVAAGAEGLLDQVQPLFDVLGTRTFRFGPEPEKAHLIKLSGNFLLASTIEALAEAFALTRKAGIAPEAYLAFLSNSLFASPAVVSYGTMIANERYEQEAGFKLPLALKDVRLALAAADANDVPLPIASLVHDQLLGAIGRGHGGLDFAGLGKVASENAGL